MAIKLASLVDFTERVPYVLAAINGFTIVHWDERWSLVERTYFLDVIEREFPDLAVDVVDHMQRRVANPSGALGGAR